MNRKLPFVFFGVLNLVKFDVIYILFTKVKVKVKHLTTKCQTVLFEEDNFIFYPQIMTILVLSLHIYPLCGTTRNWITCLQRPTKVV